MEKILSVTNAINLICKIAKIGIRKLYANLEKLNYKIKILIFYTLLSSLTLLRNNRAFVKMLLII